MTNGADPLAEFYVATARQPLTPSGRTGVHGQVDAILNELGVPSELDGDGDWKLATDVGSFMLMVDGERSDLVAVQTMQPIEEGEGSSDQMHVLLALNFEAHGIARFGAVKDSGQDLLVLSARLVPDAISRGHVEAMLADCFRLSRRVDELLGKEPPQAEPPPPEQAPVSAPAAETVFAQPVPQAPPDLAPAAADYPPPAVAEPEPSYPPPVVAEPEPEPSYPPPVVAEPEPEPSYPPPVVGEPEPAYPPPVEPAPPAPPQPDLPPANWYPDPYAQARLRYWDGQSWTEHVAS